MIIAEVLDSIQRRLNSFLFRLVLIGYAIAILVVFHNKFSSWIYVVGTILYFTFYSNFLKYNVLRLINDYAFIIFICWNKDPMNIYIFSFFILPFVNTINFSGHKKTPVLYVVGFLSFHVIYFSHYHKLQSNIFMIGLPLVALAIIDAYTNQRFRVKKFREELFEVIDDFYMNKEFIRKPHRVYKLLVNQINSNFNNPIINDMFCFTIIKGNREKPVVINGTTFIVNYHFLNEQFIENLRKSYPLQNEPVIIQEETSRKNLIIYTKLEDVEYFYLFTLHRDIPFYFKVIGFFRTIEPALTKISKTLIVDKGIQEIRNEELEKNTERSAYVNRANNMMHYIRNRLTPFRNLIAMIDREDTVEYQKLIAYKLLLESQNNRAKIELDDLTNRADEMLEKSKNPFLYYNLSDVSIQRAFSILKRIYLAWFPEDELEVNIETKHAKNRFIKVNEEGYEVFIIDWLNNVKKYRKNFFRCKFIEENNFLHVSFFNDHNQSAEEITKLIKDLKSVDRNEIMKRTTHGLYIIKNNLENMGIDYEVSEESGILEFTLKLKIYTHENSDIRE